METILEVKHLKKTFGHRTVLEDVSFSLNRGEVLGIVGRSGCGKSTMARIIARLLDTDEGEIILCGRDVTKATGKALGEAYENMQMIFQVPEDSFNPRKTLGWSIGEAMRNRGYDKASIEMRIDELLTVVGLKPSYKYRYPHEVSGGECQRAAISRAIALSPTLLICDEATSALDVTVQAQIAALLKQMTEELSMACLFITHDLALLQSIVERVIVMAEGRIVEENTPKNLIKNPVSQYTKELIAADFFRMPRDRII
ncbi:MAG: ABC transporter ATP-binding protein [Selenomonadaceae bacterium]|nr:ABC transporter ATP-binding protein [Selenomonadaceae bacterium]